MRPDQLLNPHDSRSGESESKSTSVIENKLRNISIASSSNVINVDQSFESSSGADSFVDGRTKNNRGGYHGKRDNSNRDRRPSVQPRTSTSRGGRRVRDARPRFVKPECDDETTCRGPKEVAMKNAVMMLNEMFPPPGAPQYKVVSMSGTPNNPTFEMAVTIMEQSFNGSGRSKKEAKLAASQLALEKLFGKDFTKGEGDLGDSETQGQHFNITKSPPEIEAWMALEGKNPVSILNELYPGAIFSLVSAEGPSHAPEFCVTASLASLTVEGRGNSKREAKLHASKALLAHIHQVGFDPMTGGLRANNNESDVKVRIQFNSAV